MSNDKEIRADAKLKNLNAEDLEVLWGFRYPEDPEEKLTYAEIQGEVPLRWGITVSLSTLSEFYSWLRQRRRMDAVRMRAEQAKRQMLDQDPDASLEDLERLGQMVFTSETVADGDIKGFVNLLRANSRNRKLKLDERRVALLEEKAAFADEVKKVAESGGGGITAEEMAEIELKLKIM